MNRRSARAWSWGALALALAGLAATLVVVDLDRAWALWKKIGLATAATASLSYLLSVALRVERFRVLLRNSPARGASSTDLAAIVLLQTFYIRVMPFRTGELSLLVLLRSRYDCPPESSLAAILIARVYDALSALLVFIVAMTIIAGREASSLQWVPAAVAAGLAVALWRLPQALRFAEHQLARLPGALPSTASRAVARMTAAVVASHRAGLVLPLLGYSVGIWMGVFAFFFVLLRGFGMTVTFSEVVVGASFSNLAWLMPVGMPSGPMEAAWTMGFALVGMKAAEALSSGFAVNMFATLLTTTLALPGALLWARSKRDERRPEAEADVESSLEPEEDTAGKTP